MIALFGIITGICFAWACIATSIAVANDQLGTGNRGIIARQELRIAELEDRLQAHSLSEYRAHRPVAMPAAEQGPVQEWDYDLTGLIRSPRAPRDDDDK